jgi:hypothetical protein
MIILTMLHVGKGWILTERGYIQVGSSVFSYWSQINMLMICVACVLYGYLLG